MKKSRYSKYTRQKGAVVFESVLAICVLMLVFFALLQIYRWAMAELFCHYSVFYSTKAASLGYKPNLGLRAARVAAIAISGGRSSTYADEESHAESYMQHGDASGVSYPYWHPQSAADPCLSVSSSRLTGETVKCVTTLEKMPLVHEVLGKVFGITRNPSPRAVGNAWNFSKLYLEE